MSETIVGSIIIGIIYLLFGLSFLFTGLDDLGIVFLMVASVLFAAPFKILIKK